MRFSNVRLNDLYHRQNEVTTVLVVSLVYKKFHVCLCVGMWVFVSLRMLPFMTTLSTRNHNEPRSPDVKVPELSAI